MREIDSDCSRGPQICLLILANKKSSPTTSRKYLTASIVKTVICCQNSRLYGVNECYGKSASARLSLCCSTIKVPSALRGRGWGWRLVHTSISEETYSTCNFPGRGSGPHAHSPPLDQRIHSLRMTYAFFFTSSNLIFTSTLTC